MTQPAAYRATADPGLQFPARAPTSASSPGTTADPGLQCIPPEHLPQRETTGATAVVVFEHRRHRGASIWRVITPERDSKQTGGHATTKKLNLAPADKQGGDLVFKCLKNFHGDLVKNRRKT
ncbi:uncharacterized protein LOC119159841 isoform X2 [Rhipicephalus microplus]|uniref:uncharacterized protein LOC119159841 isoform X2 n=1 Tax=Rhipicephalus microplus TaxID=6941 RepID=UPI003F6C3498